MSQAQTPETARVPPDAELVTLAHDIPRTRLVMYAGVAGDFHPLHHDEPFVAHQGYRSVFVPGMLTMAMAGRLVTGRVPVERVREFGARFHAQLWPGDSLLAFATETEPGRIEVTAVNQARALVLSAHARLET